MLTNSVQTKKKSNEILGDHVDREQIGPVQPEGGNDEGGGAVCGGKRADLLGDERQDGHERRDGLHQDGGQDLRQHSLRRLRSHERGVNRVFSPVFFRSTLTPNVGGLVVSYGWWR